MKNIAKKIIPYLFVLITLVGVGLFGWTGEVSAQTTGPLGTCTTKNNMGEVTPWVNKLEKDCPPSGLGLTKVSWVQNGGKEGVSGACMDTSKSPPRQVDLGGYDNCIKAGFVWDPMGQAKGAEEGSQTQSTAQKSFAAEVEKRACVNFTNVDIGGCFVKAGNLLFVTLPAFILTQTAYFFNVLISVTLSSDLLKDDFVSTAWRVVRDLSNMFFILALLYIAIKIILDLAGHEAKKTIAKVIVMALLINFSMFFTKVVIDTSNMLALVFYNKVNVTTKVAGQTEPRPYSSIGGEKDVAGGMVNAFNPTKMLNQDFFVQARNVYEDGKVVTKDDVPASTMLAIILLSGLIMCLAIYALFVSALSFLGRLIELWVLIIFSPFAFMSFVIPKLASVEYLGWDAWSKRLISVSFMAPIFMFFLYFIFLLVSSNIFTTLIKPSSGATDAAGIMRSILSIVMPAIFICILLLQATKFAKKGSGSFGEVVMTGAKLLGGVALGAATGGASLAATGTLGALANKAAESQGLKDAANEKGMKGWAAKMALKGADYGSKASFDLRKMPGVGALAGKAGVNMESAKIIGLGSKEGGFAGIVKRGAEKREKELVRESELLKTKKSDEEVKKEYTEKAEAYDKKKKDSGLSDKEFEKKHGKRPVVYEKAEQLNHARMKKFKENLGESGLMASLAHSMTKRVTEEDFKDSKEYKNWQKEKEEASKKSDYNEEEFNKAHPEPTVESVNKNRVKKTKMIIGSVAAGVAVASGGAALAGMGGIATAAMAGAGIKAGLGKIGEALTGARAKGEKDFFKKEEKHEKKMKAVEQQIENMKEQLKNQTTVMENFEKDGITENKDGKKDEHGNPVYKVNMEKLSENIAKESVTIDSLRSELNALNNRTVTSGSNSAIEKRKVEINGELLSATNKLNKLNALKGAEKTATDLRIQISKTGDKKHQIEHEREAETEKMLKKEGGNSSGGKGGGGHAEHKAHAEPAHEAPAHAPAEGGHDDHGHGGGGAPAHH